MDDEALDVEQALTRPDGWQVVSIDTTVMGDRCPTLVLDPAGTVSGSTGVNRFRGSYELSEDLLEMGPLATTRLAGTEDAMEVEAHFLAVLAEPLAVRWDYATLVLESDTGKLRLEPAPDDLGFDEEIGLEIGLEIGVQIEPEIEPEIDPDGRDAENDDGASDAGGDPRSH